MSNKLIRLWGNYNAKDIEVKIRRETYDICPAPEEMAENNFIYEQIWFNNGQSSIAKRYANKVNIITRTETQGAYECWCDEDRATDFIIEMSQKLQKDVRDMILVARMKLERLEKVRDSGIKIYDKEIKNGTQKSI